MDRFIIIIIIILKIWNLLRILYLKSFKGLTLESHVEKMKCRSVRSHEVCPYLTNIFNKSLETGIVPADWSFATISPIYKKGSKHLAENYRPVSLTSVVILVLEKLIFHLKENNILSSRQFGFLGRRFRIIQLLNYLDYCADTMSR